ncbi:MAG: phosphotransferase [Desulfobacterales bacterium]
MPIVSLLPDDLWPPGAEKLKNPDGWPDFQYRSKQMQLQSDPNDERLIATIRGLLEENYDLGRLRRVRQLFGGYCNKSYAVWIAARGRTRRYFLRLYQPQTAESEILFEHALLNHLRKNGFPLAAAIIPCRSGATVARTAAPENHRASIALWALFEFLDGEDKYSWTDTNLTDKEFISAAETLARLHHCGHGFIKPPRADRVQPPIMVYIRTFQPAFSVFLSQAGDRRCDRLFSDNFEAICRALNAAAALDGEFQGMQKIPIHCDYHPGNLKYRAEKCVGIFDFDWSKIDYRLFDVALALVYFTSIWDEAEAGLRPDKFSLFLRSYNDACRGLANINPLTEQEERCLVPMLSIANLYVLNWDLVDFYNASEPDDDKFFRFFDHNIGLMHWIAPHQADLKQAGRLLSL